MVLRGFFAAALGSLVMTIPSGLTGAEWYVDGAMARSGGGTSWETAFKTIQEGIDAAEAGDTVTVAEGVYYENIRFGGKNIALRGTDPLDEKAVSRTVIDGHHSGSVVTFSGSEDATCVLSGFTIRNGLAAFGGGILGGTQNNRTQATIRNNVVTRNEAHQVGCCPPSGGYGGGLAYCDGVIRNNRISGNSGGTWGGGFSYCTGGILNNTIAGNTAASGGGLFECRGVIRNCIFRGNTAVAGAQFYASSGPTYSCIPGGIHAQGNIVEDPRFVDAEGGNLRLMRSSPCIDAGNNEGIDAADTDLAGMHRITYGGKSLTVDMGAYEYVINELKSGSGTGKATFTWSSLIGKTYSVLNSDDLVKWRVAEENVPSGNGMVTSWIDDGSKTGAAPSLVSRRFYRALENP